jgi:hypothetical protein
VPLPPDSRGVTATYQYISIIELVKTLASQPGFLRSDLRPVEETEKLPVILKDITDGAAYRNNKYFIENPDALVLVLYSDEFEPCNPLGAAKGIHKILNIYATFVNIPKNER